MTAADDQSDDLTLCLWGVSINRTVRDLAVEIHAQELHKEHASEKQHTVARKRPRTVSAAKL